MEGQIKGQMSIPVGGATQVIYARKSGRTLYNNYSEFQSKFSGASQITFGLLLILLNILLLMTGHFELNFIAHGIWGGVMLMASGSVGVAGSTRKTKCLAISYMILSVISALLCTPVLALSIISTIMGTNCRYYTWRTCTQYGPEFSDAFHSLMVVFTILGGISAIWGSTLCCKAAACCSDDNEELVPMQIVTADSNKKTLPGNSNRYPPNDNLIGSSEEGYEKIQDENQEELYHTIDDETYNQYREVENYDSHNLRLDNIKKSNEEMGAESQYRVDDDYKDYLQPSVMENSNGNKNPEGYEICYSTKENPTESQNRKAETYLQPSVTENSIGFRQEGYEAYYRETVDTMNRDFRGVEGYERVYCHQPINTESIFHNDKLV